MAMVTRNPDPCTHCGHPLRSHVRIRKDPKNVYVCECGCSIEFEEAHV